MSDLRNHLFETLEALKDADNPLDVKRAVAISNVAAQIIGSVKVEVDYLKVTCGEASPEFSKFIEGEKSPDKPGIKRIS